jgi:methylglutaconyl-CoA hydratase
MSRISGVTSDPASDPTGELNDDSNLVPNPDLNLNSGLNPEPAQLELVQPELVQLELVQLEQRGPIAILTLNRPEVRNALSPALLRALEARLNALERTPSVRAIVLTGNGIFSSGADLEHLRTLTSNSSEVNKADSNRLANTLTRVYTFPKPIVAAIEGAAIAGGAGLATACDLIIAGQSAKFGYTEVRLGFVAAIVSVFLLRCIGEKHARELLLTGRLIGAAEAHRIGLINESVPDGTSLERALEIALEIAQNSTSALSASKEVLSVLPGMGIEEGLRYAATLNAWIRTTDDLKEGLAAFLERREPNWKP